MIADEVKATGSAVTMGEYQNFYMNFSYQNYVGDPVSRIHNRIVAGGQYVVTLDTGKVSQDQLNEKLTALKTTKSNLENEEFDKIQAGSISGDLLHSIGLSYFAQLDMFNQLLESKNGVKTTRIISAGITAIDLDIKYLFGMPRTASAGGLSIDVDRDLHTIQALDGDSEKVKAYNMVTGQISSYLEGGVFQQIFGGEAVSAMHILQHANMQGIKTYQINQDNADSIIPQLQYDSAKKQMFRDLINSGKEITVPEKNVTIGGWTGTGYIALNPDDGTGAYMINGGLNGGGIFDYIIDIVINTLYWVVGLFPQPYGILFSGISTVVQSTLNTINDTERFLESEMDFLDIINYSGLLLIDFLSLFLGLVSVVVILAVIVGGATPFLLFQAFIFSVMVLVITTILSIVHRYFYDQILLYLYESKRKYALYFRKKYKYKILLTA